MSWKCRVPKYSKCWNQSCKNCSLIWWATCLMSPCWNTSKWPLKISSSVSSLGKDKRKGTAKSSLPTITDSQDCQQSVMTTVSANSTSNPTVTILMKTPPFKNSLKSYPNCQKKINSHPPDPPFPIMGKKDKCLIFTKGPQWLMKMNHCSDILILSKPGLQEYNLSGILCYWTVLTMKVLGTYNQT